MQNGFDIERISWLEDVPLNVEAVLPCASLKVSELLALTAGTVIPTMCAAGTSIEVLAGGAPIGSAELSTRNGRAVLRMAQFGGK